MKMTGIKAVIFDLDETLSDNEELTESAIRQSVQAMVDKGLNCSFEQGIKKLKEILEKNPLDKKIERLVEFFGPVDEEIIETGIWNYANADFDSLKIYPETIETLEKLKDKMKLFLVTIGYEEQQNKKINTLGIKKYFEKIIVCREKEEEFRKILGEFNLCSEEVLVVGDKINKEIKDGNKLGMKTARILKGKYRTVQPKEEIEKPHYTINSLSEILDIIDGKSANLKIVAIGGGTGLPTILEGLRKYTKNLSTISTVTDSGRSSGILRKEMNVLPPGDIRNCLIALSNSEKLMSDLFQYRFENGSLNGHSFGNLFIATLTKITGSFEKAIEETSRILKLTGKVLPSTFQNTNICAELEDGSIIEQEDNIIDRNNKEVYIRSKIKKVFLNPEAVANPAAIKAIEQADLIILCPGSLFTSIITNLLVKGIPEAIQNSKAKKIYICNIMTQISQTHNYRASDHLKQVSNYVGQHPDFIILNTKLPPENIIESYEKENASLVENDIKAINKTFPQTKIIQEELIDEVSEKKLLWEKKDLLRHNPDKIAKVLIGLAG